MNPIRGYGAASGFVGQPFKEIPTSVACPMCGSPMRVRRSLHGEFYGCTKYPVCTGTRQVKAFSLHT